MGTLSKSLVNGWKILVGIEKCQLTKGSSRWLMIRSEERIMVPKLKVHMQIICFDDFPLEVRGNSPMYQTWEGKTCAIQITHRGYLE